MRLSWAVTCLVTLVFGPKLCNCLPPTPTHNLGILPSFPSSIRLQSSKWLPHHKPLPWQSTLGAGVSSCILTTVLREVADIGTIFFWVWSWWLSLCKRCSFLPIGGEKHLHCVTGMSQLLLHTHVHVHTDTHTRTYMHTSYTQIHTFTHIHNLHIWLLARLT